MNKTKDHSYETELWSYETLVKHTRKYAPEAGHQCLDKAAKAIIFRILNENKIKPQKITYYLEKRDEQSEEKMNKIHMVYKEVDLQNSDKSDIPVITVSIDEKPGVQAIKNIAEHLLPEAGKH
jgi:hypothetical protein